MRNLKLTVRYDGTDFFGWQTQPGFRTVQESLEAAIAAITGEKRVRVNCAGRTDSGVHAYGQVCNFYTPTRLEPATLVKAINSQLPEDVAVTDCEVAGQAFCANKDAIAKRYRYVINDTRIPDPFLRKYSYQPRRNVDHEAMHRAAQVLRGRHDFRCFETEWPNRMTSIRTIQDIAVTRQGEAVYIEVQADGFLYNMVRAIAGTLYQIGRGYWPEAKMKEILEGMDRREAGPTAPPQGLFMLWVKY
ncbi:MAG: tRNA pseudouridine(38-40) synthase TruA [Fimbriiglobus sp.]|jgi:tRNA pseudouridine38-40 synthase|nr:tRNA pseudouridine(38-40) synthase TruA [Fimbriiglobus sp.]